MSSSILPNGKCSKLPFIPTDGQVFIDSQRVQWIFSAESGVWERRGTADDIPLASSDQSGLMSPQQKNMLDKVPAVGGGFGIITDAKAILSNKDNPAGVISGDIKIKSESLDVDCIGYNGKVYDNSCVPPSGDIICDQTKDGDDVTGLKFKLSEKFLKTLFVDAGGQKGKTGFKGTKGDKGEDGWIPNGPKGKTGLPGEDIEQLCELEDVIYRDIPGLADQAIVRMNLLNEDSGCKLVVYKAKIQSTVEQVAHRVKPTQVSRTLSFPESTKNCNIDSLLDYKILQASGDTSKSDLQILRLPKESDFEDVNFDGSLSLTGLISAIADPYRDELKEADKTWGAQVKKYIESLDASARTILSGLANELAQCEFNLPAVEYCITFDPCDVPPPISPPFRAASSSLAVHEDVAASGQKVNTFGMGDRNWNVKL